MQIVPLEAAHLFNLNTAILGWLIAAVQPKKQHPQHTDCFVCKSETFQFLPRPYETKPKCFDLFQNLFEPFFWRSLNL
jgi:hypothetical protein